VDISGQFLAVGVPLDQDRLVPALEQVTCSVPLCIIVVGIRAINMMQDL